MALVVKDRVRVSTTTTGTGTITLGGAVLGFQNFSVIGNGNTTYYAIVDSVTGAWEVGLGTYSSTGPTLSRDTILESSTGGTAVNFAAGTKDVFVTYPAEKSVYLDAVNALTPANDLPAIISTNSTSAALRITQTGTGNALLVEDSSNPDSTPFVINADGNVGIGATAEDLAKVYLGGTLPSAFSVSWGIYLDGFSIPSTSSDARGVFSRISPVSTSFTVDNLSQFRAGGYEPTGGAAVTNQRYFHADGSGAFATNNYGFLSELSAATGSWNFYASGTADNYFAGKVGIGITTPAYELDVNGTIKTQQINLATNTTDAVFVKDGGITGWDYANKSYSITAEEIAPSGLFFSPDGTRMYVTGSSGDDVNQYALSTAWDVTTASFVRVSAAIGETAPTGVFFKPDGTVMYIIGTTNDTVREFSVSTAWDVSTITFVRDFSVAAQDATPNDLWFSPDGTKMYTVGTTNDNVYEYNLSTAWDISTAVYSQLFSIAAQETVAAAINFSADGTQMYILGAAGVDINEYALSTAWDITTAVFVNNFYIGFQETAVSGMFVDTSNNVAYVVGSGFDTVFQYSTSTDGIQLNSEAGLYLNGSVYTNQNIVASGSARISGSFSVVGGTSLGTTGVGGTLTASGAVNMSTTTGLITLGTAQTLGTFTVGGTTQTGTITIGQSVSGQTLNLGTGATISAATKAINIGTAGLSGSTTNINIGSAVAGALGDIFLNQPTDIVVNSTTDALRITQTGTGNALLVEDSANPDATPTVIANDGKVIIGHTSDMGGGSGLQIKDQSNSLFTYSNSAFVNGILNYYKSRSTTPGVFSSVQSGDELGLMFFRGDDGTAFRSAAWIGASVDGTPGTNDMPGRLAFATTADGASTPTERMRIDNAGRVGIGAASPSSSLRIARNPTGAATVYGITLEGTIQSDVTNNYFGVLSLPATQATTFTLTNLYHYSASQSTYGAGSTITNQYGFHAESTLIGATNDYGFYGNIAAGTGRWNFYANGTAANYFAGQTQFANGALATPSISNINDTNTGIYFPAADTIAFVEGGTEIMRIDSAGNVGIRTATPDATARLHVNGQARIGNSQYNNESIELGNQGTGDRNSLIDFHSSGTPGAIDYSARIIREAGVNGAYKFENLGTGGTQFVDNGTVRGTVSNRWVLNSGQQGNFNDRTLNLDGPSITQPGIGFHAPANSTAGCFLFNGPGDHFSCVNSTNSAYNTIVAAAFTVSSDYRLKTDIVDLQSGLQDIMSLSPKKYTIFDSDKETRGFIAHEVSQHIPEAVSGELNAEDERGFPVYQTLDPAAILATAVAAIQELKVLVDNQAIEIQQLKEKLNA
jgi:hypothetical protein